MVKPNRLRNIKGCPKSIQKGSKQNYNSLGLLLLTIKKTKKIIYGKPVKYKIVKIFSHKGINGRKY